MKIIVKNAVKRKPYWIYFITKSGDLDGYDLRKMNEEIDLDKISNVDLLKYNYIRLPCRCILDRYTDVIVLRVCNLHKNLAIGRKDDI